MKTRKFAKLVAVSAALCATGVVAVPLAAGAVSRNATNAILNVTCSSDHVDVVSMNKDLSNVVAVTKAGEAVRFDGLSGKRLTVPFPALDVWVKAGANFSGDGPGYGQHFDCSSVTLGGDPPSWVPVG